LTARGQSIITHTPMARFGEPADLLGTVLWLLSPASAFVTGTVVPIDGGFSAYSGVYLAIQHTCPDRALKWREG
jgi:NAD(P)-dependent dehydrogenase (short-subunit alcohol dehydrogenase family)